MASDLRFKDEDVGRVNSAGLDFPATSATRIRIFTFTTRSRCARMDFGAAGSAALDLANVAAGPLRRLLGIQPESVGHVRRRAARPGSGRHGSPVSMDSPWKLSSEETLASNGLIHDELMQNFAEIFAGRGLEPLPSLVEYGRACKE